MVHPGPKKIDFGGFLQDWGHIQWHQFCGGIKQLMLKSMGFFGGISVLKNSAMKVKYIGRLADVFIMSDVNAPQSFISRSSASK